MASTKVLFWAAFVAFAACALFFDGHAGMLDFSVSLGGAKAALWALWLGFLAYSVYCSSREDLFLSVGRIAELHWGRRIGLDLYLGLGLSLLVVYLNGGLAALLLWLLPTLLFANLSMLLYFALHFDEIVGRLLSS